MSNSHGLEFRDISMDSVDIATRSSARGRQTTVRWRKQVFIHTRLSRAYLALARLSCLLKYVAQCFQLLCILDAT